MSTHGGGGGGGDGGGGAAAAASTTRSLQMTPTWALAIVCLVFIFTGILVERVIHFLAQWLKKRRKKALYEAVEKLKSVLMLLGLMSLILAVTQRSITKICIPTKAASSLLSCRKVPPTKTTKALGSYDHRVLMADDTFDHQHWAGAAYEDDHERRRLAVQPAADYCSSKGMVSLVSVQGIEQLNIFIFVLAIMQIVYSVVTMGLGRAKMKSWKAWEKETQTVEYQAANDPDRFRYTRQTTFGRRHMSSCTSTPIQLWIKCFFRQFFKSVAKVDYLTLRHGFIAAHLSSNNKFNFQKYIQRSLEDDFKVVVGISPFMWLLVVIFMLVDVYGWHVYLWVSLIPLIIVLVVGTKLEVVVAKMALELKIHHHNVIKGSPLVQPNDKLFWLGHPELVLRLLHLVLFVNAFEFSFFIWVTWQFGFHSCYHERVEIIIIRVVLAVMVQVLCSYITLPLYALVTQMGSHYKSVMLEEETVQHAIRQWHAGVKDKMRKKLTANSLSPRTDDGSSRIGSISNTASTPNFSSHHRAATLAEFTSLPTGTTHGQITAENPGEILVEENVAGEIVMEEPSRPATSSSVDEVHIIIPQTSQDRRQC